MTGSPRPEAQRAFAARRPLMLGFVTLAVLLGGLFGWGLFSSLAGAVIASGRVEVETRDQVIEHLDGGTVGSILVRDGDQVDAGEVVIRLKDEQLRSELALLESEHAELVARRNRLEAEFRGTETIAWDAALLSSAETDPMIAEAIEGQSRLFAARRESRAGQVAQLRERIGQIQRQIAGLEAQAEAVVRQSTFVVREVEAQRELFDKGLTELSRLLALEREAARLEGQAGEISARIAGAWGRIAEIEIQILQIGSTRIEEAEGEAREAQARENQVVERLSDVRRRMRSMEVRAPVAGEVLGMRVSTVGEVVRPGEPILQVVPADAQLVVMAQLEPIHVDQVRPGQDAVLRFSAFPARNTPEFNGTVVRVSADAQVDERTGLPWYDVELAIGAPVETDGEGGVDAWPGTAARTVADWLPEWTRDWLQNLIPAWFEEGSEISVDSVKAAPPDPTGDLLLTPGMPVEVHIRTGERAPLTYLVKPLTDYFARSLREE